MSSSTRWQCWALYVMSPSILYKMDGSVILPMSCHLQHHTRWQCRPHYVISNVIQDSSVSLTMSYHVICNIIQDGTVSLSFCLSVSCQLQHHTTWQWWPVCDIFNIIQDGSVGPSMSSSLWQCWSVSSSTSYKMEVWGLSWPLYVIFIMAVLVCVIFNIIQDGGLGLFVLSLIHI